MAPPIFGRAAITLGIGPHSSRSLICVYFCDDVSGCFYPFVNKIELSWVVGVPCSNAAKTRNPLKFAGVPQTTGPISAVSGPKFDIL